MFELPEFTTLARQINETVAGKRIESGCQAHTPHKFVNYNRTQQEFEALTQGKTVGQAYARGKWLFAPLEPGYVLLLGEWGGKVLFHPVASQAPAKHHLYLKFTDGAALSAMTQMWGAMELYDQGQERERFYIRDMCPTPTDPGFTFEYFSTLADEVAQAGKQTAKGLLTQDQSIPGLGNAIAQDILFRAKLHPKHPLRELDASQRRRLYDVILQTVNEVIAQGGRNDEYDLYNRPGGYRRTMDKNAAGQPCPECGTLVEKIQYLGGACYFCPRCQQ